MPRDNLKAPRIASALMTERPPAASTLTRDDLEDALKAVASMSSRTDQAQAKFSPGSPHYSLQLNRLDALRVAAALMQAELHTD